MTDVVDLWWFWWIRNAFCTKSWFSALFVCFIAFLLCFAWFQCFQHFFAQISVLLIFICFLGTPRHFLGTSSALLGTSSALPRHFLAPNASDNMKTYRLCKIAAKSALTRGIVSKCSECIQKVLKHNKSYEFDGFRAKAWQHQRDTTNCSLMLRLAADSDFVRRFEPKRSK